MLDKKLLNETIALLDKLFEQHPTVIAVGGSGLYVKALCDGLDDLPEAAPEIRRELAQRLRDEGLEPLWRYASRRGSHTRRCVPGRSMNALSASS